ncbi:phage late control D family protein [Salinigranum halophilum]|uniref:phage late control D family protein n=1 Tax=Salinigranum halophilum TaxID=2565931 RepID=UPI00115CB321|nr:contractile injection system protein, VgrG/Pvc8 family [Salinigranum halophilum]
MSLTHLEDDYDHFYNPRFELELGGRTVREADGTITGLSVETALDRTNRVSFALNEPYDHEQGGFPAFVDRPVTKGTSVVVRMGYGTTLRRLFSGTVESVQPNFPASGGPTVEVSGRDSSYAMTKSKRSQSWDDTTLSSIVTDVVSDYDFEGTAVDVPSSADIQFAKRVQQEQTDYAFLDERIARRFGLELFVRNGTFHCRGPDPLATPVLTLTYGRSLRSFRPNREDTDVGVGEVEVRDWDASGKSEITATATVPGGTGETSSRSIAVESQAEADRIATAVANELAAGVGGQCETIGLPEIREGKVVRLNGLSQPFDGPYYVERTTHRMDDSGYTTSFEARDATVFEGVL